MEALKLYFSPCPNDTFIFDALVNGRIKRPGPELEVMTGDIETLNQLVFSGIPDIAKLSFHAYAHVADKYYILPSGAAMGENNGPLLVSKRKIYPDEVESVKIAIPGEYTTANLLLGIACPGAKDKIPCLFSDIEEFVLSGEADAGLIIHETRFSYEKKGLSKIIDLGEYWQEKTGMLIPLGGIAIKKVLPNDVIGLFSKLLRESIEYAVANPGASLGYIRKYAQELDDEVIYRHIQLYVNDYTIDMGDRGRDSLKTLYRIAFENRIIPSGPGEDMFPD
ncbi:MAG: 1,4-dihydroxy-6-naphthoate synthase [Bacteroidota bacterium]